MLLLPAPGFDRALAKPSLPAAASMTEFGAVRRHWRLASLVFLAVSAVGVLIALSRPVLYEAAAIVLVSPREPQGVVSTQQNAAPLAPDSAYIASQVEILRSPALAAQLVDRLDLLKDKEFNPSGRTDAAQRAKVVERVLRAIEPRRRGSTYVVEVAVRSKDPAKAALMSNALVDVYLTSRTSARIERADRTRAWLGKRLAELAIDLRQREEALQGFRAQAGLITVNGVAFTEQQLQNAEVTALAARTDLAEREARWRQAQQLVQGGGTGETMSGALTSEVMAQLRQREADVDRRLAEYADRYGPLHPTVVAARAEKTDITRQINAEVGRLTESLRNDAEVARTRTSSLQGYMGAVRSELVSNNLKLARLNELERGVSAAQTVYTSFQQRYTELADGAAGVGDDAQLIAAAQPASKPASRGLPILLGFSMALGLAAGALAALFASRLSSTVQTPEEVEVRCGLPVLTTVPRLRNRDFARLPTLESHPGGFLIARPRSAFAESIRLLRSRIARARSETKMQTVAIASALPREGKTTTALCLARVSAMSGKRVVLIDCDLRGGALNALLGIDPQVGILDVLQEKMSWRDVIGIDDTSGAHVIPAATDSFTAMEVFDSDTMRSLIDDLGREYDLIVLDCPPVLLLAEARDIAVLADGVVLVARRGRTSSFALRKATEELHAVGANILGSALNAVETADPGRASYGPLYFRHGQDDVAAA